jgi:hypothetical protein
VSSRGSRTRSPWAILGLLAIAVVAVNLGLRQLDRATRSPGGPTSSSFATAPDGVAAYAELLRRYDRPVIRLREAPSDAELDPRSTLALLDASGLTGADGEAVGAFLRAGGRLLYADDEPEWFRRVDEAPLVWKEARVVAAEVPEGTTGLGEVRKVAVDGYGVWAARSDDEVLLETPAGALAVRRPVGRGAAVLLSDASPLQNRLLATADNAAFGLAVAGSASRPVVFAESFHGYGTASGLDAIPGRWWWAFGGLCLAALVLVLARGRRLGPPELPGRELPPPRAEFAQALAIQLAKTRPRVDAERTARRIVRERLVRMLRLPPDAPPDDVRAAAAARDVDNEVVEAVLGTGSGDAELLALGRALRRLEAMEAVS